MLIQKHYNINFTGNLKQAGNTTMSRGKYKKKYKKLFCIVHKLLQNCCKKGLTTLILVPIENESTKQYKRKIIRFATW